MCKQFPGVIDIAQSDSAFDSDCQNRCSFMPRFSDTAESQYYSFCHDLWYRFKRDTHSIKIYGVTIMYYGTKNQVLINWLSKAEYGLYGVIKFYLYNMNISAKSMPYSKMLELVNQDPRWVSLANWGLKYRGTVPLSNLLIFETVGVFHICME